MPPKIIARNADRTGGVLPVNAAARALPSKGPAPRLKLEIRRLPPGLTLTEFEDTLGEEWKLNNGKINWREYRQGKIRAPGSGKVAEQSRCYVHAVNEAAVKDFEKRFLEVVFHDQAGTHKSPDLRHLPPTVGFAPNQRTPLQQAKQRADTRQGTIDQDAEFIAFLEAETQPLTKPSALEIAALEKDAEKPKLKTTPLIEDLREKKANKAKAAQAKAEKAAEKDKKAQATKSPGKEANASTEKDGSKGTQQQKVEQAAKDAAKALTKQVAGKQPQAVKQTKADSPTKSKKQAQGPKAQSTALAASSAAPFAASSATTSPAASQRIPPAQRQRGNTDGIKKMLQKDLGIKPKTGVPSQPSAATSPAPTSPNATTAMPATQSVTTSKETISKPTPVSQTPTEPRSSPVKAYLKHANPSQGMTEMLIQQALSQYGEMSNVTIDPRKGTAIAVFKSNEGLKKALEAKRVTVANGAVEVLEFRERAGGGPAISNRGGFRGGRGGRGGARGGAQNNVAASGASSTPAADAQAP